MVLKVYSQHSLYTETKGEQGAQAIVVMRLLGQASALCRSQVDVGTGRHWNIYAFVPL